MRRKTQLTLFTVLGFYRLLGTRKPSAPDEFKTWLVSHSMNMKLKNLSEARFVFRIFRHLSRIHLRKNVCFEISLFMLSAWPGNGRLHLGIEDQSGWQGHAWVTLDKEDFTTDQKFSGESIYVWEKPLDL